MVVIVYIASILLLIGLMAGLGLLVDVSLLISGPIFLSYFSVCFLTGLASKVIILRGWRNDTLEFLLITLSVLVLFSFCYYVLINASWVHIIGLIALHVFFSPVPLSKFKKIYSKEEANVLIKQAVQYAVNEERERISQEYHKIISRLLHELAVDEESERRAREYDIRIDKYSKKT